MPDPETLARLDEQADTIRRLCAEKDEYESNWQAVESQAQRLQEALEGLVRWEHEQRHSHQRPGIWDSDNGPKANTPCEMCADYEAARAVLASLEEPDDGRYITVEVTPEGHTVTFDPAGPADPALASLEENTE